MSELHKALFKLQGVIRGVKKDSKNPHFKNSYASLEAVTDTIRPHMQELGLFWFQTPGKIVDNAIEVRTVIGHAESGETIEGTMEMPLAKRDPQGAGSSLTYAMRYSLMAILGLPPTDDDAETAIDRDNVRKAPEESPLSAHKLKKDGVWETVTGELENDLLDCHSLIQLEQLKAEYREKVVGWPKGWKSEIGEKFAIHEKKLMMARDAYENQPNILMAGE